MRVVQAVTNEVQRGTFLSLQLDHVFICCDVGAPEADALLGSGLVEGTQNVHPGQGTANRRFFFQGGFVELLWVANPAEAQSELAAPTRLWTRWLNRHSGSCPFGIGFSPADTEVVAPPFDTWDYRPGYLPPGKVIRFAQVTSLQEPELFYLAWPHTRASASAQPVGHTTPLVALKSVSVGMPPLTTISSSMRAAISAGLVNVYTHPTYELKLGFSASQEVFLDLSPLPLLMFGSPAGG